MARPTLKEERTEEILKAYESCIAKYGVEGATLQKIAAEAGLARPMLRHYIGNSGDILMLAASRFVQRSTHDFQAMCDYPYQDITEFLTSLFFMSDSYHQDTMIASAFIITAQTNEAVQQMMMAWFAETQKVFEAILHKFYPDTESDQIAIAATGLIGIYFNSEALFPLWQGQVLQQKSFQAAKLLLANL